jgi:hypothetical protein
VADFPPGGWSVGAQGAYALITMGDVNRVLTTLDATEDSRYGKLKHAWEGAVDARYAFRERLFVGLEGGYLRGRATDPSGTLGRLEVSGVPIQLIGGGTVGRPTRMTARVVVGVGVVVSGKLGGEGGPSVSGTGFLTSLGGEFEYRVAPSLAVTAQALVRQAKVSKPGDLGYDLDFTGASFRAGVRGYFGGHPR